jgi:trehalose 6-phosphate synthase/phosphatase
MGPYSRLLVASNRLPFAVESAEGDVRLAAACGGLAAALSAVHQSRDSLWIGWPGDCDTLSASQLAALEARLRGERVVPVTLSGAEIVPYYDGVCNSILWPVFHYLLDRLPLSFPDFEMYRSVNERFADAIVREYEVGDVIWIHDYHLMLVPAMVRLRLPKAVIGFFLHTPFPAADVFRVLPWRRELLDGVLGATLLGFQTHRDAQNFGETVRSLTEYHVEQSTVIVADREVRFATHAIEIGPLRLKSDEHPALMRDGGPIELNGRRLLLGIDRLDYTKGIPRRLAAFERLLEENPRLRGEVQFVQVAVPSRSQVPSYIALREEVEALVSAINSRYGSAEWTPVHYLARCLDAEDLTELYRAADVMLVTSLRDGMNLVAKEFVQARSDDDGVLILSELAGASEELHEALSINPYSVEDIARAMATALVLERDDRRQRMRALRERVTTRTLDTWVERFTADLTRVTATSAPSHECVLSAVRAGVAKGDDISLVLVYEGVLVPALEQTAGLRPDPELLELLRALSMRTGISVHVVSGFSHGAMQHWFDRMPATLWAEHGLWRRDRNNRRWRRTQAVTWNWEEDVRELLNRFAARCPGAFVEQRGAELIWNFSRAERIHGHSEGQMLGALLREAADALGLMVTDADHTITVRPAGLTIERTLQKVLDVRTSPGPVVVIDIPRPVGAVRDVLTPGDVLVTVGTGGTNSDVSLTDLRGVRSLLWDLVRAFHVTHIDLAGLAGSNYQLPTANSQRDRLVEVG